MQVQKKHLRSRLRGVLSDEPVEPPWLRVWTLWKLAGVRRGVRFGRFDRLRGVRSTGRGVRSNQSNPLGYGPGFEFCVHSRQHCRAHIRIQWWRRWIRWWSQYLRVREPLNVTWILAGREDRHIFQNLRNWRKLCFDLSKIVIDIHPISCLPWVPFLLASGIPCMPNHRYQPRHAGIIAWSDWRYPNKCRDSDVRKCNTWGRWRELRRWIHLYCTFYIEHHCVVRNRRIDPPSNPVINPSDLYMDCYSLMTPVWGW